MSKSILITGGAGFFGQAFARRQIWDNEYDRICIYSRDEWKQAQMRRAFMDDSRMRWFIGDVRDRDRLRRAMNGVDVVVHAAALKRVEVGHYNPEEMVKTNVNGAANVVDAADTAGVRCAVLLSTDKAYQPVSPYGQTKAVAENMFLAANGTHGPSYTVVRYGNIAGSTGSVIPTWRRQMAESDGLVTVTDLNCTRFWMRAGDAVNLVHQTISDMYDGHGGGEVIIPELKAYTLGTLAAAMGVKNMQVTGLPKWEKKHESMQEGKSSEHAEQMTVEELEEELTHV